MAQDAFKKKPFRYYGGKTRLASRLISMMPGHDIYVEPFLGSGSVICAKSPVKHEMVNDADDNLVTFFRVMRDRPDELVEALRLTPYSKTEYWICKTEAVDGLGDLETARRFFVVVSQSFAATTGPASGWSATMKKNVNRARSTQNAVERLHMVADRFRDVQIANSAAWDFVDTYCDGLERGLVYCDPPYPHASRSSGSGGHGYAVEMSDDDHARLAESLKATSAAVMVSGYACDLYDQRLYPDWYRYEIASTATVGQTRRDNRARVEVVWSNCPLEAQGSFSFVDAAER